MTPCPSARSVAPASILTMHFCPSPCDSSVTMLTVSLPGRPHVGVCGLPAAGAAVPRLSAAARSVRLRNHTGRGDLWHHRGGLGRPHPQDERCVEGGRHFCPDVAWLPLRCCRA